MSYQVLARKYRPQRFAEVVGQIHVTQTLQNALTLRRVHHAYLFTGARGVGKTTVARILAKALNCEKGVPAEPCDSCNACLEVLDGKSMDVLEIDGASNTSVEDVRQIREQVKYLPVHGGYKIYIIDEVHMLSTSAFNALLKTLEEPPAHVIFVFATTEPHKIPATVLSRCQRYDFRRIPVAEITKSLEEIAAAEKVTVSKEALHLLASEAQGSLRDSQSLLDQAIAFAGSTLQMEDLQKMFGFMDKKQLWELLEAILKKDRDVALRKLETFYQTGSDLNRLAQDLLMNLRHLLLIASIGELPASSEFPDEELKTLKNLAALSSAEDLDLLFQLAYRSVDEIGRSNFPKMVFEILLVRLCQISRWVAISEMLELSQKQTPQTFMERESPRGLESRPKSWEDFVSQLSKEKPQLAAILHHGRLVALEENLVTLSFEEGSVYGEMLLEEDRKKQFQEMFSRFFGRHLALKTVLVPAIAPKAEAMAQHRKVQKEEALTHESVQEAMNVLGAVVEEVRTSDE